jgi:hypothetical protein
MNVSIVVTGVTVRSASFVKVDIVSMYLSSTFTAPIVTLVVTVLTERTVKAAFIGVRFTIGVIQFNITTNTIAVSLIVAIAAINAMIVGPLTRDSDVTSITMRVITTKATTAYEVTTSVTVMDGTIRRLVHLVTFTLIATNRTSIVLLKLVWRVLDGRDCRI